MPNPRRAIYRVATSKNNTILSATNSEGKTFLTLTVQTIHKSKALRGWVDEYWQNQFILYLESLHFDQIVEDRSDSDQPIII